MRGVRPAAPLVMLFYPGAMSRETNYEQCYHTLNLRAGASLDEIKQRYRELARRYHPDTVPPTQRAQATLQFQQINQAKEALESYWETHHRAPISRAQRFQYAVRRHEHEQYQRPDSPRYPRSEPQRPPHQSHAPDSNWQRNAWEHVATESREDSSTKLFDRILVAILAESVIILLLWVGYFVMNNVHDDLMALHARTRNDLVLKFSYGFLDLLVVSGSYLACVALLLLALLFLVFPYDAIQQMFSSRRKRPDNPYPHLSRPYPRQKW